ncbi:HAD family hydrolase [Lysinibacillus sp. KU-BSD001]|uniref:HAD-IIB family hydrolase n=1 Tax=Lysinibacillus sp. KU-BSD001 TaxID=3141328 RepID=UPI0036EB6BBE
MNFVFDLDGTICFQGQPLEEHICAALDLLLRNGHQVIFASARPIRDMLPVLQEKYHTCAMVGGNGAFTYRQGTVNVTYFSNETTRILKDVIKQFRLTYLADSDWDYAYTGSTNHPIYRNIDPQKRAVHKGLDELNEICKLVLFSPPNEVKEVVKKLPVNVFEHHAEDILDISPMHIDKISGLHRLQIYEFIAFGNDANDACLFEQAVYSVCVGNHPVSEKATEQIEPSSVAAVIGRIAKG